MLQACKQLYHFGPFCLDLAQRVLLQDGQRVNLPPKVFETLRVLVENHGRIVEKDELIKNVWPDTFVEEGNLTVNIFLLRKVLGKALNGAAPIETIPRRGYCFAVPVDAISVEPVPPGRVGAHPDVPPQERESDSVIAGIKRHRKAAIGAAAVMVALAVLTSLVLRRLNQPSKEFTQKRLTFNSSESAVQSAAISPDGKYLAYSDPEGIHVKLFSTGDERLIARPAAVPTEARWSVDSWFPDGTQLLADSFEPGGQQGVWSVPLLGQAPRMLHEGAGAWELSPDGTRIAFAPQVGFSGYGREVQMMDSQGANSQRIFALGENEGIWGLRWSPDGRRLAYLRGRQSSERVDVWIETCDLKGANRTLVVSDPRLAELRWLPDGRMVYSRQESQDSQDSNLWQVGIDGQSGRSTGKPKQITQWAGFSVSGLSTSAEGHRLVFRKATVQTQVYLGELTAGGMRMLPPQRLTNDEANDVPTTWTPDSKAVLFSSDRNGTSGIFKREISRDATEVVVTGARDATTPRLSADGDWFLYSEAATEAGPFPRIRLMRIPVGGGVPQFVLETKGRQDFGCSRAPARLCWVSEASEDGKQLTLTAFDPQQGRGKVLRAIPQDPTAEFVGMAVSPDGSTFAVSKRGETEIVVQLLSLLGGSDREIRVRGWPDLTGIDWSPDGKGLYLGSRSAQSSTLLYVDFKGNARVLWRFKAGGDVWGVPSPDGRYLAILGSVTNSNVWMLEGF